MQAQGSEQAPVQDSEEEVPETYTKDYFFLYNVPLFHDISHVATLSSTVPSHPAVLTPQPPSYSGPSSSPLSGPSSSASQAASPAPVAAVSGLQSLPTNAPRSQSRTQQPSALASGSRLQTSLSSPQPLPLLASDLSSHPPPSATVSRAPSSASASQAPSLVSHSPQPLLLSAYWGAYNDRGGANSADRASTRDSGRGDGTAARPLVTCSLASLFKKVFVHWYSQARLTLY